MTNHIENIEILKKVCVKLNKGWVFNSVLSKNSRYYFLSNGQGMFIKISFDYGKQLPQWCFCFKHPKYKEHYHSFETIGCGFSKPINSIVSDVNLRLLNSLSDAKSEMEKINNEYKKEIEFKNSRKFVVESISKVFNIQKYKHHSRDSYEVLSSNEKTVGSLEHLFGHQDKFNINLVDLNAHQVIQILTMLNNQ
jgi:hypothetical protein